MLFWIFLKDYLSGRNIASAINSVSFRSNLLPVLWGKMFAKPRMYFLIEHEVDPARFCLSGLAAIGPKALIRRVLCSRSRRQPVARDCFFEAKFVVEFARRAPLHFFIWKAKIYRKENDITFLLVHKSRHILPSSEHESFLGNTEHRELFQAFPVDGNFLNVLWVESLSDFIQVESFFRRSDDVKFTTEKKLGNVGYRRWRSSKAIPWGDVFVFVGFLTCRFWPLEQTSTLFWIRLLIKNECALMKIYWHLISHRSRKWNSTSLRQKVFWKCRQPGRWSLTSRAIRDL